LTDKNLDVKLKDLQKNIQALDAKVQALSNRPAPAAPAPVANSQKEVIAEIQKLKKDLEAASAAASAAAVALALFFHPPKAVAAEASGGSAPAH
jgi:seryl-tRNA synthetase